MKVTVRQIEAFLALAELGSFSLAADRIGLSQPSLSKSIRDLEEEVGASLFHRTTRRVELSHAGLAFLGGATRVMDELQGALTEVRDTARLRRGRLRIAAPPFLASTVLPRTISSFAEEFPGLRIELADVTNQEMLSRLNDGLVDIGFGTLPPGHWDVRTTPLLNEPMVAFCPGGHPLTRMSAPGWADVAQYECITLVRGSGLRELVELGFEKAGANFTPRWELEQIFTIFGMLSAGIGIAILPRYTALGIQHHDIVSLPLSGPSVGREISCIFPARRSINPAGGAFIERLRSELRRSGLVPEKDLGEGLPMDDMPAPVT